MLQVEPAQIGPYTYIRRLGESSTTCTYLYRYTQRKKYVVIKLLATPFTNNVDKEAFLSHAKLLKKLKHRNIAEILDFGLLQHDETTGDYGYLVVQYVQGSTLRERFTDGQYAPPDEVKRAIAPVADALHYAHVMNVVHGNLHPGNILVGDNKDLLVTDFMPVLPTVNPESSPLQNLPALLYAAPERLRSMATPASDQYSLAVMAYEWLCGRRPFTALERAALLAQQEQEQVPSPRTFNSQLSALVEGVLLRALAKDPTTRFPHTLTFADAYLRALMGFPMPETPPPSSIQRGGGPQADEANTIYYVRKEKEIAPNAVQPEQKAQNGAQAANKVNGIDKHTDTPATASSQPVNKTPTRKKIDQDSPSASTTPVTPAKPTAPAEPARPRSSLYAEQSHLQRNVTADLCQGGVLSQSLAGYEERVAQVEMANAVARSLAEDVPAIIEAATGTGKALDVDTPIATLGGWKRMGDLVTGDTVFDEQGCPTHVTRAFDIMYNRPCYEVMFSDGSSLVADAEHEWATYTSTDRQRINRQLSSIFTAKNFITVDQLAMLDELIANPQNDAPLSVGEATALVGGHHWSVYQAAREIVQVNAGKRPARYARQMLLPTVRARLAKDLVEQHREGRAYRLVTTEQMAATLTAGSFGCSNHAVKVAGPLMLPEADLPIAPYFLGAWLGDGSSYSNQITTADPELLTEIEKDGYTVRSLKSHPYLYAVDNENGMGVNRWQPGMTGHLRTLGVLRNKHIPTIYLRASEQQRRALLAGLLDTDGTVNRVGAVEFTTTSPQLAQDVYELMCSLGFRPSKREGRARCRGKDCGPKWTLAFTTDEQVFRLQRKVQAHKERLRSYSRERNCFRYVVAVREVPSRPVRCIQVDSPNHLYLAGRALIPTHNSLAYLVPIVRSSKVAIISTANKALQEQLFYKDIPFVQKYVKRFDAALMKGMGNYVCLDRMESERIGIQHYVKNREFLRLLDIIQDPDSTFQGDFETLGFPIPADIRSKINADRDQCAWSKCGYFSDCYVRKMKVRASQAQVIVVNHTLLLLDAAMEGYLLPERDVIVIDEAHHLEEEATRAFTVTISQGQVATLLAQHLLKEHSTPSLQEEAKQTMVLAWERLYTVADPGYKGRANLHSPLQEGLRLSTVIADLADSLRVQRPKDMPEKESQLYDKLISRTQNLADNIRTVFSVSQPDKYVYYVERVNASSRRGGQLEVSAAPLNVTSWLKEQLFNKTNVICTSATLATIGPNPAKPDDKGPNFAYFRRRIGLDYTDYPNVQERILPLIFDYESKALLYLPRHLPEPVYGSGAQGYTKAIASEMMKLVEASRGRAFLLFSSKRMLDEVYEEFGRALSPRLQFPLLKQGDMTRIELVRMFREREGAVLFGLKSFWEGVDIAGEALSLVVVDKLPFDPPDDPVHEARIAQMKAAGENWFGIYVLPQAVLRLKQGLGRLLRARDDRGVMAILDTRLHTKGYGRLVLNALPPARRTSSLKDVEIFFTEEEVPF